MALQKNKVSINFAGGIDTKTDEKLVVAGKLLELENGIFTKAGAINKRNGYNVLPKTTIDNAELSVGSALGSFNNELNLYTGKELYTYSTSTENWVNKGPVVSLVAKSNPIIRNSTTQYNPVSAYNSGFSVHAWQNANGGVSYSVIDEKTGVKLVHDRSLANEDRQKPKVVALGANFVVIFTYSPNDTSLKYDVIAVSNSNVITSSGVVTASMDTTYTNYDVATVGDRVFIIFDSSDTWLYICYMSLSLSVSVPVQMGIGALGTLCMNIVGDDQQRVWVTYKTSAHLRTQVYSYALTPILATTIVDGSPINYCNVTVSVIGDKAYVYYEAPAAQTYNQYVKHNTITIAGVVGIDTVFLRGVGLAAKSFVHSDQVYVPLVHESPLQSGYFIASSEKNIVARLAYQNGGTLVPNANIGQVSKLSNSSYLFSSQIKGQLLSDSGILFTQLGVSSTILDFTSENRFQNSQLGQLYIAGGCVQSYDGVRVVEDGFNLYPENVTAVTTTTGGLMLAGSYQYVVCYEWTDNLGQVHRSAPSIPKQITVPGGTSTNKVTLTIPSLRLTSKQDVRIVVYRTQSNGTIFYRTSSITSPLINQAYSDTQTLVDTNADTAIVGNDYVYTTGGVLENIATPACSLITTYKNRVVIAGLENPLAFWYSKYKIPNSPVEFTDLFQKEVDARGGDITAIGVMDGTLVIFKHSSIYAMVGDGPNDLGQNDDYTIPTLITTDVGCANPNSVVSTPDGLMFQSSKGIYLLSRSMEAIYIGAPVEKYNSELITSSQLIADSNQIRFTTNNNVCLVYDYFFQQWSVFTNHTAEDSALFQGQFTFVKSDGAVWQETPGLFVDDTLFIPLKLTTSWLSLDVVQGYERVYRMMILGEYKSPHKLEIGIGFDFNNIFTQNAIIDVDSILNISAYGEVSPYGQDKYGGEWPLYQFKTHMTRQKCQSVRFTIKDLQTTVAGEAFSIANMSLEVGVKQGLNKDKKAKSFSTSR